MQIKTYVKIENMSNEGIWLLRALASFIKVRLPNHFARSGHKSERLLLSKIYILLSGPFRYVSVAFVMRRGEAFLRFSEVLSQLIFPMRSGMFFLHRSTRCVLLARS